MATVKRLMSAVSFGYGIFHLAVSLLPPKLLHLINAFGFEGDRQTGIQGGGMNSMEPNDTIEDFLHLSKLSGGPQHLMK